MIIDNKQGRHDRRATDLADMFAQSGKPEEENRQRLAEIGREI